MTIEGKLRLYILENYCTMANFGEACGLAPTTLSAMFKRGLENCSASNLFKICDTLGISVDALKQGEIIPMMDSDEKKLVELNRIIRLLTYSYRLTIDNKPLSDDEIINVESTVELIAELLKKKRAERDELLQKMENSEE